MQLRVDPGGGVRCLYSECIDLASLGAASIRRASRVEPDGDGQWYADLSPVDGPRLGPFVLRSQALDAERDWLEAHWLTRPSTPLSHP
jgi:hypothetical protein